jgi:polysaccharide export outer membrane protein
MRFDAVLWKSAGKTMVLADSRRRRTRGLGACLWSVVFVVATIVPSVAQTTGSPTQARSQASIAAAPGQYVVGPNDALVVTVFDQPQLTGRYVVQADGTFTFPLLGRVSVGGLSLQAVENEVRDRLAKGYLKDPQVGVSVDQYRSQQIFVMGEVRSPGTFQFTGAMTLIEALARAGSTTDRAGLDAVIVRPVQEGAAPPDATALRRAQSSDDSNVIHINLETLQSGTLSQNLMLRSGDTIFVPRAETVFVSGQVNRPGELVIRPGMTIRQVLSLAGGVTDRGSERRIQIIRQVDGKEQSIGANLQDKVRNGDTILVRERFF